MLFIKSDKHIWQQVDVAEVAGQEVLGYVSLGKMSTASPAPAPF